MKTVTNRPVAQGDILITPIGKIPKTVRAISPSGEYFVIAHSETGHHHVIDRTKAEVYEAADDAFIAYIRTFSDPVEIKHLRSFDTHESYLLEPNKVFQVRRQREYVPQGFRAAAD